MADIVPFNSLGGQMYPENWPEPKALTPEDSECESAQELIKQNIIDWSRDDLLTTFSEQIARQIQFPINTVFMHGLGVIASAMTKSFKYEYYGSRAPVTLFVVTAQPPSTGKSGVNRFFTKPVRTAFVDFNDKQKRKRGAIEAKIKHLKGELKKTKSEIEEGALLVSIGEQQERLEKTPLYRYSVSNVTPEALESIALGQDGLFNVISDEAGSINTLVGGLYSDKKSNADIVLQGWDGDWLSSARITRDGGEGYVRGSIAVIAQDETISTILTEGLRGNGVSERFLLLREFNVLGKRDHDQYSPVDEFIKARYAELVNKLVFSDETIFKFSNDALKFLRAKKNELEPELSDSGKYAHSMLRGVVGKMDKQVMKMSCVLHVIENWTDGSTPETIGIKTVEWAYSIYEKLIVLYVDAADSQGFIGINSEIETMKNFFVRSIEKSKYILTANQVRDGIKNHKIFNGRPRITNYMKQTLIPQCIELNLCMIAEDGRIMINPRLAQ